MAPELLILDEPTAGLDPAGEELLLEILADLEATLLLVSHDMFFVGGLTRRTLVMHQGRIAWDLPTREFMRDEALGSLNGLAFIYRRDCGEAIRALQHEHEHSHPHRHRHVHPHRHGQTLHAHPHEHIHQHPHRFAHRHPGGDTPHEHPPGRCHEHDHPGHAAEPHDHEHE
jgi:ABC-type multidrug transport system ATPase subunit